MKEYEKVVTLNSEMVISARRMYIPPYTFHIQIYKHMSGLILTFNFNLSMYGQFLTTKWLVYKKCNCLKSLLLDISYFCDTLHTMIFG